MQVLAQGGPRALTHRAVDRVADLPAGSTSNAYRTRADLVSGITEHLLRTDQAVFEDFQLSNPSGFADPARALADYALEISVNRPHLVRARLALVSEAMSTPSTLDALRTGRETLVRWGAGLMAGLGVPDPDTTSELVVDLIDGAVTAATTLSRPIDVDALAEAIGWLTTHRVIDTTNGH